MSKRLQVLVDEREYRDLQRVARRQGVTVAEWVRRSLRAARREVPGGDVGRKLQVLREAAKHEFPTADIEQMLAETERGYLE
jgi:hypothetical protein